MNEKLIEKSLRPVFTKFLLLASKKTPLDIVTLIVNSRYAVQLGGINSFDNIIWFNKELVEESLNDTILLMALDSTAVKLPDVFKLHKTLFAAKLKSNYKAELFIKEFELKPAKKAAKAKTPVKSAKPAKAPVKKTAAKQKATATAKATKKPATKKAPAKKSTKK